ncbi:MAG: signal recognition particle-docking protein FtsY [Deltaproteobacteria bacterium]|nr:signal recognition particle-docking protein FtsY [Deltaproteobacteria bacterium]
MLSLLRLVAAQSAAADAPAPTAATGGAGDVVIAVVLAGFFVALFAFGFLYLRRARAQRIEALGRELERPLAEPLAGALPEPGEAAAVPAPRAADLVDAEKKALLARAEADAARRAAERAAERAVTAADDDARARAAAEAAALKAAEQSAAQRLTNAEQQAKALRLALGRTRDGIMGRLATALGGKAIDASVLDDVETVLLSADIGARTADRLLQAVKAKLSKKELSSVDRIRDTLRDEATAILATVQARPLTADGAPPRVVLVLGVNGAGKTTTIGKLAAQLKEQGHKVLMGAGDTFRAAAADQLEVWAERAGVPIVTGPDQSDPSSVLFDAVKKAKADGCDVVLCDTAGRLHTKTNLMEELKKVVRTLQKACDGAPHEVILVLDATVGQNAIAQAKQFGECAPLTGIVLTKLDGTAKGGVVLGIVDELKVPVRYIGVGERIGDLRPFDPAAFTEALFSDDVGAPRAG